MPHRLLRLLGGQLLFGVGLAALLRAGLGPSPWDVLHQGLVRQSGLGFGVVVLLSGVAVLLCWLPLRVRPGLGTVTNVLVVAVAIEIGLAVVPPASSWPLGVLLLLVGLALNGLGTALYLGVRLGPGPRDGLMTGLVARTGYPVALVRGAIEGSVVLAGWLLGGTVGVGTVVFALAIGPLVGLLLPRLSMPVPVPAPAPAPAPVPVPVPVPEAEAGADAVPAPRPAPVAGDLVVPAPTPPRPTRAGRVGRRRAGRRVASGA
ncbi:membrane protein YczE [Pseudokineococcus sp. 1T1Z-3]|uniref:membrane protein YczE n=1 Tax=Pseudokineococcus sp. 1T1Z-3 TaxID=3132745 RepID=UPI00403F571C